MILIYLALLLARASDWTGQYESGGYVVVVCRGDDCWIAQWCVSGELWYYGEVRRDNFGRWVETYPEGLSPNRTAPIEWQVSTVVPNSVGRHWRLRRIRP